MPALGRMFLRSELIQLTTIALCLGLHVVTGTPLVVFQGDTAELPCTTEDAVLSIDWKKGVDPATAVTVASFSRGGYVGSDGDRITMLHDRTLVINSVKVADEGAYLCIAQTSASEEVTLSSDLIVAVPPQEPYPTLVLVSPAPEPSTNASCQHIVAETTRVYMRCQVANFRPAVNLEWQRDGVAAAGSRVVYMNNTDGTRNAYSNYEFAMGGTSVELSCLGSGDSIPDDAEPRTTTAVICPTSYAEGGGGLGAVTIVVIVILVLLFLAALVGLIIWIKKLLQDTMVRSTYTKTVSADDDTPATSKFSNYCHFCRLTCCPCLMREELYENETSKKTSRSKDETDKKPTAPSAALRARLQQNRKKQEGKTGAGNQGTQPAGQAENSPMLDDAAQASAAPANDKPQGARPKTRPSDDAVIIRDPNQAAKPQRGAEEGTTGGEAETGF